MPAQITSSDLVESHKPKNFKFFYNLKDESLIKELEETHYDISSLNTINNDELIQAALASDFTDKYDREVIKQANVPTVLDEGIILSKQLATKADKKLEKVLKSIFIFGQDRYVAIKLQYEKFDIIQIFVLA